MVASTQSRLPFYPAPQGMRVWQGSALSRIDDQHKLVIYPYGAGKGWPAMEFAIRRYHNPPSGTCFNSAAFVFVEPRNILSWKREIKLRYPEANIGVMEVDPALLGADVPYFIIIPHSQVARKLSQWTRWLTDYRPAAMIWDESTAIKNGKTQIAKAAILLAAQAQLSGCFTMGLTGKSMPEGAQEIWSQFAYCYGQRNPLGTTYYSFLTRWFIKHDRGYALRLDCADKFYECIKQMAVVMAPDDERAFIEYLGDKKPQYILEVYEPSSEQLALLDTLYETWSLPGTPVATKPAPNDESEVDLLADDPLDGDTYSYTISLSMKAAQIASGFYYLSSGEVIRLKSNPKMDHLKFLLKQLFQEKPERQIIIWHRFKAEREMLLEALLEADYSTVVGPDEDALLAFVNKGAQIILMPAGVTRGFNELAEADTAIWWSSLYSQEKRDQGEARNSGARQKHPVVNVIDLGGDGMMDQDIAGLLQAKNLNRLTLQTVVNKYTKGVPPPCQDQNQSTQTH